MLYLEESCTAIFECQTSVPAQHCSALQDSEECDLTVGERLCVISCCKCSCLIFPTCNVDVCSYRGPLLHGFIVYALVVVSRHKVVVFPLLFLCFFHSLFIKRKYNWSRFGFSLLLFTKKAHFHKLSHHNKTCVHTLMAFMLKNLSIDIHNSVIEMN